MGLDTLSNASKSLSKANKPEPAPTPHKDAQSVTEALISLLLERREGGKEKYGTELMTFNNRNAVVDALQESMDLTLYLVQHHLEQQHIKELVKHALSIAFMEFMGDAGYEDADRLYNITKELIDIGFLPEEKFAPYFEYWDGE